MENGSEIQLLVYQEGYVRLFLEGGRIVWQRTGKHAIEKEQILELMGLLTERQRDIVILYFYYGETQWEIAKELGITQPQFLRRL